MTAHDRDPGLDTLLDLHGETLFVDEAGHWVQFMAVRTDVTAERPHGLSYSLTLHAPDGTRLVGFDNAHPVGNGADRERGDAGSMTIGTGCEQFGPMSTGTRQRSSRTSGWKLTPF